MGVPGRATSWATILVLVLLTGGAAAGSISTAPVGPTGPINYSHGTLSGSSTPLPRSAASALSLARRGLTQSFVATYRLTTGTQRPPGSDNPSVVVVAQRGPLANLAGEQWFEPGQGEWAYLLEYPNGERREMVKRSEGLYSCGRNVVGSWECDGPDRYGGGNGVLISVSAYEPVTQYAALQETLVGPPPTHDVRKRTGAISGQPVSCVTAGRPAETWCYTSRGWLASFPVDGAPGLVSGLTGALVKSSAKVPRRLFILPVRPTPWSGPLM